MRLCGNVQSLLSLGLSLVVPQCTVFAAEQHIVPPSELHEKLASVAQSRRENLAQLDRFFSSEPVAKALRASKLDGEQVRKALPSLGDAELQRLASRAQAAQAEITAGSLSNQDLTYIVIALATAVLILIIVAAR